jgi:HlyD family secretion protein
MKLFTPGRIFGLLVVAGLAGGAYWWQEKNKAERVRPQYRTVTLDRGTIAQRITANGTLNPVTVVNVGTQISGTVTKLHADFNSAVKAGQVLAELDPSLLKAQIAQTEANRRSAEATLTLARATLARNQSLRDKGFISDSALDSARKDLDAAYAQLAMLKAQIDRDRTNLAYSVIRSPIKGIVVDRTIDVGQTVAASFQTPTLFKIAKDLQSMQIDTSVSEADIGTIQPGMPVLFSVDAFRDRDFTGRVRVIRLNPTVQQNVVTYNVVIDVKNDTGVLLPGMTAQVNIVTQRRDNVLRIPNVALRFRPSDDSDTKTVRLDREKAEPPPSQADAKSARSGKVESARPACGAPVKGATMLAANGNGGGNATKGPAPAAASDADVQMGRFGPVRRSSRVYRLYVDGSLAPVEVRTGIADMRYTEVVGDTLKEGDAIVVREVAPDKAPAAPGGPGFRMRLFG